MNDCFFPQRELVITSPQPTGDYPPMFEVRQEFSIAVACYGVQGIDACSAMPLGSHENLSPFGRYQCQTSAFYR